jgi:hypothetical protein
MPTTPRPPTPKASSKSTASRPRSHANRVRVVSQSDVARARGCARSTVSRACLPGGALHAAVLPGSDRLDAAHPACRAFVGPLTARFVYGMSLFEAYTAGMVELDPERFPTLEAFAERLGVSVDDVRRECADAIIKGHNS